MAWQGTPHQSSDPRASQFPTQPEAPRKGPSSLLLPAVSVGVVSLLCGAGAAFALHQMDHPKVKHPVTLPSTHAPTIVPTQSAAPPKGVGTAPPGWQVAAFPDVHYAYNVPSEWTAPQADQGALISFDTQWRSNDKYFSGMVGQASWLPDPKNPGTAKSGCSIAFIGATSTQDTNSPLAAAKAEATAWANGMMSNKAGKHPKITMAAPRNALMGTNAAVDVGLTAVTTAPLPDKTCGTAPTGTTQIFHAYGVKISKGVLVFIVQATQNVQGAVPDATLEEIIKSIRGIGS